jgi:hypothetical protein
MKIMFNKISSTTTKIKPSTLWNNQQTYLHISRCDPWNSTFEGKAWNDFVSNIMFNVIKSLSNLIILKLSRFKIHNLNIDWLARKIYSKIDQHPKWKPIWSIFIEIKFFTSNTKIIIWRQKCISTTISRFQGRIWKKECKCIVVTSTIQLWMELQKIYNHHLNPSTISLKWVGKLWMKILQKNSYNIQNHLHAHHYFLWRRKHGFFHMCVDYCGLDKSP